MGYFVLSSTIAMVLGPFIGLTVMNHWSTTVMFLICIVSTLFSLVFGLIINLPMKKYSLNKASIQLKDLFESSAVPISIIGAIFALVYSSVLSFVSVYANEIGLTNVSSFFFVVYAVVLLLSRPFTGKWFDLYGENWIIYPSLICFGIGMYVLGVTSSAIIFILSAALIGLGWGTAFPSFQTIAIQYSPPKRRGLATATFLSIFDLGIGIGSFVVGFAINKVGFQVIYQAGSGLVIVGILIYYYMHGRKLSKSKSINKEVDSLSH
jgi:MFS family permease